MEIYVCIGSSCHLKGSYNIINALKGLISIVEQAGASVAGCCAEIEKGFQGGGDELRNQGYQVESLAIVESMGEGKITFRR